MEHGTRSKYVAERCRCDACREANRVYMKQYMARRYVPAVDGERAGYLRNDGVVVESGGYRDAVKVWRSKKGER